MTDIDITTLDPLTLMRSIIQRIATGPELSKDISQQEACFGMRYILENRIDPVQAAIFLIALRMKRETWDENKGVLDALLEKTQTVTAPVDEVLDIVDPYNGYNRTLPPAPFLPALLAEFGVATVTQGIETLAPKFGVTHKQILRAAGVPVDLNSKAAAARLAQPSLGWTYIDQSQFCPELHALINLRTLIVKRPVLTTVEVLTGPIRGRNKTHFVTGYVHKPYPPVYAMLARHSGFDSALLVRGIEGGIIPSLRQTGKAVFYHDKLTDTIQEQAFNPKDCGIEQDNRAVPLPTGITQIGTQTDEATTQQNTQAFAKAAATAGMDALAGTPGPTFDALAYGAGLCLWYLKKFSSIQEATDAARQTLTQGNAVSRVK